MRAARAVAVTSARSRSSLSVFPAVGMTGLYDPAMTPVKTLLDATSTGDNCQMVLLAALDNCHDIRKMARVPYRPPSHPPETAWARHLDAVMRERGWSRVRLFEEVGGALGYAAKSRSAMLPLLVDREPTPAQAAVLERHFGTPDPIPAAPPPVDTGSDVAAAIREQTAVFRELIQELRLSRSAGVDASVREAILRFEQERSGSPLRTPVPAGRGGG